MFASPEKPQSSRFADAFRGRTRILRPAFTLLEVILALAILAGAIAMIGELISLTSRNAADSEEETRAQLLAVSLMDEIVVGMTEARQASREPLEVEDTTPWVYSISLEGTKIDGLTSVEVVVEQDIEKRFRPVKYRLIRWLPKVPLPTEEADSTGDLTDESTTAGDGNE